MSPSPRTDSNSGNKTLSTREQPSIPRQEHSVDQEKIYTVRKHERPTVSELISIFNKKASGKLRLERMEWDGKVVECEGLEEEEEEEKEEEEEGED